MCVCSVKRQVTTDSSLVTVATHAKCQFYSEVVLVLGRSRFDFSSIIKVVLPCGPRQESEGALRIRSPMLRTSGPPTSD